MHRSRIGAALIIVVALCASAAFVGSASAAKTPCAIDENGNCVTADPTPYYEYTEAGEDSLLYYGGSYRCKVVHAARTVRNIYWVTLFRYVEQVRWCYDGSTVREFTRWRWSDSLTLGMWHDDGDTGSSCTSEYCTEQIGSYWEHASTTRQFHPNWCPFNFCGSRNAWVDIGVAANGQWGANTGG